MCFGLTVRNLKLKTTMNTILKFLSPPAVIGVIGIVVTVAIFMATAP